MRSLITMLIRKRNPAFVWPASLPAHYVLAFSITQLSNLLRGLKVCLYLRKPKMMLRERNVRIAGMAGFKWGAFLKLGEHVYVNAMGGSGIYLGEKVGIGAYSRLVVSGSITNPGKGIKIGNNVGIGEYAYLGGGGGLEIGDHCIAGQYLSCHPENHITADQYTPIRLQGVTRAGIKIGSNCWMGSKVTILDGVTIGDNCIIAAGAVVNKSFPANSVIGGVPARLLKNVHEEKQEQHTNTNITSA